MGAVLAHALSDLLATDDERAVGAFTLGALAVAGFVVALKRPKHTRVRWREQRFFAWSPIWWAVGAVLVLSLAGFVANAWAGGRLVGDPGPPPPAPTEEVAP